MPPRKEERNNYAPTEKTIAREAAILRQKKDSPSARLARLKKAGEVSATARCPAILVRLYSVEQRELLKRRAAQKNMTENAYCLYLLFGASHGPE